VLGGAHGYARDDATPTIEAFEVVLGAIEHGTAVAFSSGMAAVAAVVDRVRAGGRLAIPTVCYQGTTALARRVTGARGATLVEVDQQDTPRWIDTLRTCDVVVVESPQQPPAAHRRPRHDRWCRRRTAGAAGGRQHPGDADDPATPRARRRRRGPQRDQGDRRPEQDVGVLPVKVWSDCRMQPAVRFPRRVGCTDERRKRPS